MTFQDAIASCMGRYFTFSGRATRSEYWWFFLFCYLMSALATISDLHETLILQTEMLYSSEYAMHSYYEYFIANILLGAFLIIPSVAVGTRRLHDIGRTGWWQLIGVTGIGCVLLLYWFVQPTRLEANKYGDVPTS